MPDYAGESGVRLGQHAAMPFDFSAAAMSCHRNQPQQQMPRQPHVEYEPQQRGMRGDDFFEPDSVLGCFESSVRLSRDERDHEFDSAQSVRYFDDGASQDEAYCGNGGLGDDADDCALGLRVPCRGDVIARLRAMLKGEAKMVAPRPDYIEAVQSGGMSSVWRRRICEWLLEFVDEFDLTVDTVAVAVLHIDRYMSSRTVEGCIVQLVAMAAIMVASKVHESTPLQVNDVQWLAEGVYCESDIRLMELDLLHTIGWEANPVTSYQFMRHLALMHADFDQLYTMLNDTRRSTDETLALYEEFEARCLRAEWFLDLAMSGELFVVRLEQYIDAVLFSFASHPMQCVNLFGCAALEYSLFAACESLAMH
jgi:hypothetical protein